MRRTLQGGTLPKAARVQLTLDIAQDAFRSMPSNRHAADYLAIRHLAHIGRGNNNRPIIRTKSAEKQKARLEAIIQKQRTIAMRKGMSKRRG